MEVKFSRQPLVESGTELVLDTELCAIRTCSIILFDNGLLTGCVSPRLGNHFLLRMFAMELQSGNKM